MAASLTPLPNTTTTTTNEQVAKAHCDSVGGVAGGEACLHRLKQHISSVRSVAFSRDDDYLSTLGGRGTTAGVHHTHTASCQTLKLGCTAVVRAGTSVPHRRLTPPLTPTPSPPPPSPPPPPPPNEDDNALVVWESATGTAICGSPAAADTALASVWLNTRNDRSVRAAAGRARAKSSRISLPSYTPRPPLAGS